jgi:hypothetical protein
MNQEVICYVGECSKYLTSYFSPLGVASCCASIQLVPYDAVNRNKVSYFLIPTYI